MKRFLTIFFTALFFVVAVILGLKNQQLITVHFLVAQNELRLSTLLAIIFSIGFSVALFLGSFGYLRLKIRNRRLHRINKKQLRVINDLRIKTKKD